MKSKIIVPCSMSGGHAHDFQSVYCQFFSAFDVAKFISALAHLISIGTGHCTNKQHNPNTYAHTHGW